MGIRLVESIKLSYGGGNPGWDFGLVGAAVLFDGENFAVCSDAPCQLDGPQFTWADLGDEPLLQEVAGWYGPGRVEELVEATPSMACDGYHAEPAL
ncbi:MAG: hypothetical protein M3R04_07655 [bacterium]|nr:hypothetical protein [bacterium]